MKRSYISWSSGKDCAFALSAAKISGDFDIIGALTSINASADRVSMHGVRREILLVQLDAVELKPLLVELPYPCSNEIYECEMEKSVAQLKAEKIETVIFGDLFLEDVRAYREKQMETSGIDAKFPLWKRPTQALSREMVDSGLEAYVVTLNPELLDVGLCGSRYDHAFLDGLPAHIDPCGENGEFHTLVANAPCFKHGLTLKKGETIVRDGFAYTDFELET